MSNAGPKHTSVATCHKDYGLLPISILSFFLSVRQLLSFSWDYLVTQLETTFPRLTCSLVCPTSGQWDMRKRTHSKSNHLEGAVCPSPHFLLFLKAGVSDVEPALTVQERTAYGMGSKMMEGTWVPE